MKKFLRFAVVILVLTVPMLSLAMEFRAGEQLSIGKSEKITNDAYVAGSSVASAGSVNGDLFTAGGNIIVSGDVGADLFAVGGNVNILSNIGDDVRAGGGTVILAGKVKGDVMIGGGQISVGGPGIGGDVAIGGGNIRIDAPIAGNLFVGGGNVYINAPIGGNVKINAKKVTLGSNAVISGNLNYQSNEEMTKEGGAIVNGKVDFKLIEKKIPHVNTMAIFGAFIIWKFFTLLACALAVGLILRRFSKEIVDLATQHPLSKLGRGLMAIILIPIISILLFVTMVGIPFGILGLLGFVILMLFTWIVTPIVVGSVVYRYFSKRELEISWKTILLGVLVCTVLGIVPFIGCFVQALLMFITLGSIIAFKTQIIKEWR